MADAVLARDRLGPGAQRALRLWTNFPLRFKLVVGKSRFALSSAVVQMSESRVTCVQPNHIEAQCVAKGMRMTEQRRIIARVLSGCEDHPDVEELFRRCAVIDSRISISTVYRTVKLFEDAGIIERHDFRDGRARYEQLRESHHDHLINLRTGEVIEFESIEIERLQAEVARRLGYKLVGHRLELYAVPLEDKKS
jgi:Fur family ferric uptake transcriptional regulator